MLLGALHPGPVTRTLHLKQQRKEVRAVVVGLPVLSPPRRVASAEFSFGPLFSPRIVALELLLGRPVQSGAFRAEGAWVALVGCVSRLVQHLAAEVSL